MNFERGLNTGWRASFINSSVSGSVQSVGTKSLVIGIDFGTTYTGVAYAQSITIAHKQISITPDSRKELEALLEKIFVIKDWPNSNQQYAEKTPSLISYANGKPIAWGGQVSPTHDIRIADSNSVFTRERRVIIRTLPPTAWVDFSTIPIGDTQVSRIRQQLTTQRIICLSWGIMLSMNAYIIAWESNF
jgi:hypothetical protein